MSIASAAARTPRAPQVPLVSLDYLWFQVAGTVCNLRCTHCFISCAPDNHSFWFLDLPTVLDYLERSRAWGVKEYYFTGGEPFMNKELLPMLEATLAVGPASVLTNATLLPERTVRRLAEIEAGSRYSLELRVSLDGPSPETNDPIRGEGTFERAMEGVGRLVEHGFLPIITAAQVWCPHEDEAVLDRFYASCRKVRYERPRIKILPSIHLGREVLRSRGYDDSEIVTAEMMEGHDLTTLLCSSGRVVTNRGVYVCPILIDDEGANLGDSLEAADRPFEIDRSACYTCWLHGAICTNTGHLGGEA
ncbi:MAG: radical SAM protein [Gemmatimonadetes bacterium]|uniref:Radical SAM protein n=1 Tax=Candidatus Kutchimonas denitrificans TaxID=3056748 RepID=A0AAE4Z4N1_9BACT|nr:radical SAM protein [Gemmatimonadota bacterium]NIR73689.1 radical SAM protein [Candidatus Kutchimonas denitrificans]NIS00739.1 radical SAM protein [Gemmatimonadota bacterium]NIT66326.1 radical SAM protein [Gemmatimonadota bacterium]NIU51544.1 radical SAM protein [Gemmatimonadota bacterium]